jgi:hypothetical protein
MRQDDKEAHTMITYFDSPACAGMDSTLFYTAAGPKAEKAKAICATCSQINKCLRFALRNEDYNDVIYGGMTGQERKALAKEKAVIP